MVLFILHVCLVLILHFFSWSFILISQWVSQVLIFHQTLALGYYQSNLDLSVDQLHAMVMYQAFPILY